MGTIKWFLGKYFQWIVPPDLSQTGFELHPVKENKSTFGMA
jgi:hypothetical protein